MTIAHIGLETYSSARKYGMAARIDIQTQDSTFSIDVANTSFAQTWVAYSKNLTKDNFYLSGMWDMLLERQSDTNIDRYAQELHDAIEYCQTHITDYDFNPALAALDKFMQDNSQQHCNLIHRTFTFMTLKGHLKRFHTPELDRQVHIINSAVHQLESAAAYQQIERRQHYNGRVVQVMFTDAGRMEGADFSMWNTPIRETFDHRVEDTDYSVWLNEDILGKDLVRCFLDEDDPTQPDITGNLFLTPSLYIDIDKKYHEILTSKEFNDWHASTCPDKTLNRWPIGNVNTTDLPTKHQSVIGYTVYD